MSCAAGGRGALASAQGRHVAARPARATATATLNKWAKVMPHDYTRALAEQLAAEGEAEVAAAAAGPAATLGYAAGGSI